MREPIISNETDGTTDFIIEIYPQTTDVRIAFGLDELADGIENYSNKDVDWNWEINPDGLNEITVNELKMYEGTYEAGDVFQVAYKNGNIYFYQNGVNMFFESTEGVNFPLVADVSIYYVGDLFKADLYILAAPQNFVQTAQLNIALTETPEKEYTAIGYEYNQWSLNFLDYYFYTDQIYTANGYEYEATGQDNFSLTETAAQEYTANGLNFVGVDEQEIILNFAAAQEYTPQGYNFEQSTQENIYFDYVGAQAYTAEGYDVATMAQENILMVSIAAQIYTPIGYNFEASASQEIIGFIDTAVQEFRAHFEQTKQETINLTIEAAQTFTAHFEQTTLLNFALNIGAVQDYTAIGYTRESTITETIAIDTTTSQIFARHYDQTGINQIILTIAAIQDFQANFESNAAQTIFIEDLATATAIFSDGLQFQENAQENINLSEAAAQTFTAFGGFEFNQSAVNNFGLNDAAASIYELGETGKFTEYVAHYLYLQEDTQAVYTRNWLEFENVAAESINGFTVEAASVHMQVNIFEANAAENLDYIISPLQFYGKYFEATAQDNIGFSINATSERNENYLSFHMQANEFFFLHFTDIAVHEINYLQIHQNMYYDFWFWDYADQIYSNEYLEFNPQATEIIDLTIDSTGQYTNANMLNGFATENIGLIMAATAEHTQAVINHFIGLVTDNISLNFSATAEHIEAHIFESLTAHTIALNIQALSEYEHINVFNSQVIESIDFEHWATLLITTEPRNYEMGGQLNFKLKIVNWVYFESDIYVQTYKIEITKPNTLWEPTEQDRPMVEANQRPRQGVNVEDTIFGGQDEFKIDRRILNLTNIDEPTQISYASEIKKPSTLYTKSNEIERGLMDD